ncbi:hypothetical protein [Providencia manganoxydans]|uniref:tail fiber/spike domain-containing protein n=1 Tax=Providencia manganoxydans TaxID=2923283 RepID=UPI0034DD5BE0
MREVKPTQKPAPSSDIKDLFFNSGLLDIWATSLERKYIDRFGNCHLTASGMEWLFKELVETFKVDMNTAIVAAGYITIDSFQQGAEITKRNEILRDETTGEYYRWDGDLPKPVPVGSTPQSTGGIGKGAWVSVGDASLRSELGVITKTYNTAKEMASDSNIKINTIAKTLGRSIYKDGGAAEYYITQGVSFDGFFHLKTANGLTAVCQSELTLKRCGAVGDYDVESEIGTDDSDAIEFFFSQLEEYTGTKTGFKAEWEAQKLYAKDVKINKGNYLLTRQIKRGANGLISYQNINSEAGAFIHAVIAGIDKSEYAIELHQLNNCKVDLNIRSKNCGALLIDSARNTDFNLGVGCNKGESAVKYMGVIFNCNLNHRLNQNVHYSSIGSDPDSYMILGDFRQKTYADWSGMVLTRFSRTFAAGGGKGIKLLGGGRVQSLNLAGPISQVKFEILELEGTEGIALDIENFSQLAISTQWSEQTGGAETSNTLSFKNGDGLNLTGIRTGEIRDNILIDNVNAVIMDNFEGGGHIELKGNIYGLSLRNPRFKATKWRDFFTAKDSSLYSLRGVELVNPMMVSGDGGFSEIGINVISGGLSSQDKNYISSPDLSSGVQPFYVNITDAGEGSILGVRAKTLTVADTRRFPSILVNLKNITSDFSGYLITAFKSKSTDGQITLLSSGVNQSSSVGVIAPHPNYGTYNIYQSGWIISISRISVSAGAANKIDIVWNYNEIFPMGTEFIFGGAMIFDGNRISLPQ